jgi:hypothetical protein
MLLGRSPVADLPRWHLRIARYHLYLSHGRQIGMLSTTLQLRFTLISAKPRPPAFRLGAMLGFFVT